MRFPNSKEVVAFIKHLAHEPITEIKTVMTETPKTTIKIFPLLKRFVKTILRPTITFYTVLILTLYAGIMIRNKPVLAILTPILVIVYLRREWATWYPKWKYEQRLLEGYRLGKPSRTKGKASKTRLNEKEDVKH